MTLLMTRSVSERSAIEKVLGGHRLAPVDAGIELAAAEHWVAIRLHR